MMLTLIVIPLRETVRCISLFTPPCWAICKDLVLGVMTKQFENVAHVSSKNSFFAEIKLDSLMRILVSNI